MLEARCSALCSAELGEMAVMSVRVDGPIGEGLHASIAGALVYLLYWYKKGAQTLTPLRRRAAGAARGRGGAAAAGACAAAGAAAAATGAAATAAARTARVRLRAACACACSTFTTCSSCSTCCARSCESASPPPA